MKIYIISVDRYDNFLQTFLIFEGEEFHSVSYINSKINMLTEVLSQFDLQKELQLKRPETVTIIR